MRAPDLPRAAVERASSLLAGRLSRRSLITRSAFVGSAVAAGGLEFVLRPGTAYAQVCTCGNPNCSCGSTCCAGFSEFCCSINNGYNWCPSGTLIGGWWLAEGSIYCNGPRYYLDCNAQCQCLDGCGDGYPFCDTGCDGQNCGCALDSCDQYVTGCFQFRYGQCNQQVACVGRIECRLVSCVPPWEVDPTCTTTLAEDDSTANMNAPCNTSEPEPPPPPPPPCDSPVTNCQTVGLSSTGLGRGYAIATTFGKVVAFGDAANVGDLSKASLTSAVCALAAVPDHWAVQQPGQPPPPQGPGYWLVTADGGVYAYGSARYYGSMAGKPLTLPVVGIAPTPSLAGYWLVSADGGIFAFGDAGFHGSRGGQPLAQPIVGMAATPSGQGYWLVAADGGIFNYGDAGYHGSTGGMKLDAPVVGMAATPSGHGYWLAAADGGVFTFGDATFYGSNGGSTHQYATVGIASASRTSEGYWLSASDGAISNFNAPNYGSAN